MTKSEWLMVNNMEKQEETEKRKIARGKNKDYPLMNLESALEVAKVVDEMKGHATREDIEKGLGKKGGGLSKRIAATRKWGLVTGVGEMELTEMAKKILHPLDDKEGLQARKEAFFSVSIFNEVHDTYGWKLPREDLLINFLTRKGIPKEEAITLTNIIFSSKTLFEGEGKEESFKETIDINPNPINDKKIDSNLFYVIFKLGKLSEQAKTLTKIQLKENLVELKNKMPSLSLFQSQLELVLKDIEVFDEKTLPLVIVPRIENIVRILEHELKLS